MKTTTLFIPSIVDGDVNSDGVLNVADIVALTEYVLGKDVQINAEAADLFKDSRIDVYDVIRLRQIYSLKV